MTAISGRSEGSPDDVSADLSATASPLSPQALCRVYDVALLDLDGVVYLGPDAVDGAVPALHAAAEAGMRLAYVTNNASRPPSVVRDHLVGLGLDVADDDVVTSAQAGVELLRGRVPAGSVVAVVGGPGVAHAVAAGGFHPVDPDDERAVALLMGYGPDVGWRDLASASFAVQRGAVFVATNTDRTVPTARGIAPGNGLLVQAVAEAGGQAPVVAGKPEPALFDVAVERTGADRPLVVGDRLDTDIEGATRAGLDSLLVLTGVSSVRDAVLAPPGLRPTYVAHDLSGLLQAGRVASSVDPGTGGRWTCGSWSAFVEAGAEGAAVRVEGSLGAVRTHASATGNDVDDDGLDGARAACAAAWSHEGPVVEVIGLR